MPDTYRCSYCKARATYVGAGQDGDFYCPTHRSKAPGDVEPVDDVYYRDEENSGMNAENMAGTYVKRTSDEPTFPVSTRVESAETYSNAAKYYLDLVYVARQVTGHADYAEEQRWLDLAADNLESALRQVRGAVAQSKTDQDYAERRV